MKNIDFIFPLPPKNLHIRYDEVFNAVKKGLNPMIVGLPQSSRSAYLKFIITHDKSFLKEFINQEKYQFIQIETKDVQENRYISSIAYEAFGDKIKLSDDPLLVTASIKNILKNSSFNKKVVFVIYELDDFVTKNPETYKFILELLSINKHQPQNNGFQAIFICSPKNINRSISDKIIKFNLFNKDEMEYTKKRLEYFRDKKIEDDVHKLSLDLSFGHYLLYKFLSDLDLKNLKQVSKLKTHETISELLETIWKGVGSKERINEFSPISDPVLLPPISKFIRESDYSDVVKLTSQERVLFDKLKGQDKVFSRDEVAQIIWGSNWTDKYSDWAIDKLISKLKTKLIYSKYEILTMRGRGYQIKNNVS